MLKQICKVISRVIPTIISICIIFLLAFAIRIKNERNYKTATDYYESGEYSKAQELYSYIGDFGDSFEQAQKMEEYVEKKKIYEKASEYSADGKYEEAIKALKSISGFEDADIKLEENIYALAKRYFEEEKLSEARKYFLQIEDYGDSEEYLSRIDIKNASNIEKRYKEAMKYYREGLYSKAYEIFKDLGDYNESKKFAKRSQELISANPLNHKLAVGVRNGAAITGDGDVLVAGTNKNGQKNKELKNIISVDAYGYFVVGLTEGKKVEFSGVHPNEQPDVSNWKNIIDVACGENFIVALDDHGRVYGDGHKDSGQLEVDDWEKVVDIDTGWSFTVALTEDKELKFAGAYGEQENQFKKHKEEWKDVVSICAGGGGPHPKQRGKGHTVGLREGGKVVAVGDNSRGQCDVSGWKDIVKVAAGDWYTVGLDEHGTVYITGDNFPGTKYIEEDVLKTCTDIIDIAAGFGKTLCLREDGSIVEFGFDKEYKVLNDERWRNINS